MAAPPLTNSFEGGSDTTTITTGNSGGTSGNAFDAIVGTTTFSATHPAHGSLGCKCDHTSANAQSLVRWSSLGSITTDVYWRMYAYLTTLPNNTWRCVNALTAAAALSGGFTISTAGRVGAVNAAGSGIGTPSGSAASTNQVIRLEGHIISATSNGTMEMRLWNSPESTGAADDTLSVTTGVLGANTDRFDIGLVVFNNAATWDPFIDDLAVSTSGWIGPLSTSPPAVQVPVVYPPTKFGPF